MKPDGFQIGDVFYDRITRTLFDKDGAKAPLRNKSRDVLACLLEQPNQTVTKAHFLDTVWSDVIVSDESLVQCIADIRRVIGKDARHILETVPREGYRINLQPESAARTTKLPMVAIAAIAALVFGIWLFWPKSGPVSDELDPIAGVSGATAVPGTFSSEAYLEVLQGRLSAKLFSQDESLIAERHFRRAIELDPAYARAYAELGTLLAVRFENNWTSLVDADREKALFYAEQAVSLNPDLWLGHYALGRLNSLFGNFDLAEVHLERAMSLQPDNEDARAYYAVVKTLQGDPGSAVAILAPAIESHPNPPFWYYFSLGHALFNLRRFDEAEQALNKCLSLAENSPYCLRYLIAVYSETGNTEKAKAAIELYSSVGFEPSIKAMLDLVRFQNPDDLAQLEVALRRAGVPD